MGLLVSVVSNHWDPQRRTEICHGGEGGGVSSKESSWHKRTSKWMSVRRDRVQGTQVDSLTSREMECMLVMYVGVRVCVYAVLWTTVACRWRRRKSRKFGPRRRFRDTAEYHTTAKYRWRYSWNWNPTSFPLLSVFLLTMLRSVVSCCTQEVLLFTAGWYLFACGRVSICKIKFWFFISVRMVTTMMRVVRGSMTVSTRRHQWIMWWWAVAAEVCLCGCVGVGVGVGVRVAVDDDSIAWSGCAMCCCHPSTLSDLTACERWRHQQPRAQGAEKNGGGCDEHEGADDRFELLREGFMPLTRRLSRNGTWTTKHVLLV